MLLHAITKTSKVTRNSIIAGTLTLTSLSITTIMSATPTHALSLGGADLSLPLGSVGKPLTDLLSPVTEALPVPISLDSSRDTLGAEVALPSLSNTPADSPTARLNVQVPNVLPAITEPLSSVTNPILEPVSNALSPVTTPVANTLRPVSQALNPITPRPNQPLPPATPAPSPTGTLVVQRSQPSDSQLAVVSEGSSATLPSDSNPLFAGVASFFTSTLPEALSKLTSGFVGKQINPLPIAISALILLLTTVAAGSIMRRPYSGGTVMIGRYNLTKFAQAHDVTQFASLAVAVVGFGAVAIFLALA